MICFRGLGPVPIVQRACFVLTTFSCRFYVVLVPLFLISRRHHSLIYMLVYLLPLLRVVSFVQQLLLYGTYYISIMLFSFSCRACLLIDDPLAPQHSLRRTAVPLIFFRSF